MKKILAAALSLLFILALTVPGFADGDTVVTMEVEVPNVALPENCEWTLTIPADFSINFARLYDGYLNYMTNHPEGITFISATSGLVGTGEFSLIVNGLPRGYKVSVNTTHTPMASPDTDTSLEYGISFNATDFPNGKVETNYQNYDDVSFFAKNINELEGKSGSVTGTINALTIRDIEAIGALKSGSYSSTITFTSALEPIA